MSSYKARSLSWNTRTTISGREEAVWPADNSLCISGHNGLHVKVTKRSGLWYRRQTAIASWYLQTIQNCFKTWTTLFLYNKHHLQKRFRWLLWIDRGQITLLPTRQLPSEESTASWRLERTSHLKMSWLFFAYCNRWFSMVAKETHKYSCRSRSALSRKLVSPSLSCNKKQWNCNFVIVRPENLKQTLFLEMANPELILSPMKHTVERVLGASHLFQREKEERSEEDRKIDEYQQLH